MTDPAQASPPRRRTQRERREATVGKLVEATIAAISEVGYARASVQEICGRAGVSHGGLFRHFDTRLDLVVAVAEEVGRRRVAEFRGRVDELTDREAEFVDVLRAIRAASRTPLSIVWFELLMAARTDAELRYRLRPTIEVHSREVYRAAQRVPVIAAQPEENRQAALFTGTHLFDGESLLDTVYPRPDLDEKRVRLLAGYYRSAVRGSAVHGRTEQ